MNRTRGIVYGNHMLDDRICKLQNQYGGQHPVHVERYEVQSKKPNEANWQTHCFKNLPTARDFAGDRRLQFRSFWW